jgi:cytochrome c551/c552
MNGVPHARWSAVVLTSASALLAAACLMQGLTRPSEATPAYARRYGVECATCHSPMPPRLNTVGMVYRRAGFRLPDSDDSGNLKFKSVGAKGIGDAAAIAIQMDGQQVQNPEPGQSKTSAELSEVELIFGTAIDEHYSAQMLFIPYNDAGESELENAEVQANFGKPEMQWTLRAGKAQPMYWQKSVHGSTTLSSPLILSEDPVAPIGSFAGVGLGKMLAEVEGGFMYTKLQKGKMMSTVVSVAALNGFNEDGSDARTHSGDGSDFLAQATELFGSRNTLNAFYYDGHTVVDPLGTELLPPGPFPDRFNRMGLTGNYSVLDRLDVAAGYASGQDKSAELGRTVKTNGAYGEVTATVMPQWVAVYRYDQVDPDSGTSNDSVTSNVISTTYLLHSTVFIVGEYQEIKAGSDKTHTISARVRFVY